MSHSSPASVHADSQQQGDLALYRRLLVDARRYWPHTLAVFVLTLAATPLALLTPLPLQIVADNVLGDQPLSPTMDSLLPAQATDSQESLLLFAALLVIIVAIARGLQGLAVQLMRTYTGEKLVLDFRTRLFRHVQRLSLSYHDMKGTADSTYRIQYDASSIQRVVIDGVIPFVGAVLTFASMLYITFLLSWQLCALALVIAPFLLGITRMYRPRLRTQSHVAKKQESSALRVVQEVLTQIRVVKAFGQEEREADRFIRTSREGLSARLRLAVTESGFDLLSATVLAAGTALTLFVGANLVLAEALTLGELLLVLGYISQMYDPLRTMARKASSIQNALASADRAFELLDHAPDVSEAQPGKPLVRAHGSLRFSHVSFRYADDAQPVLSGIDFTLEPGTRLGVSGATGAGKTTLVNLITRFYDPTQGVIELDGVDLREYRLRDLRNQFAIVLQEPVLFSASIGENIAYARPDASDEEIVAAADAAHIHEFISRLPDGYATLVGERGMRLSGGERQRISLARAFLKDAPVLILDEPTSSVDVRTEATIMRSMERLMQGRTTIMIAHRLSTLDICDVVVHLEDGGFTEPAATVPGRPQRRDALPAPSGEGAWIA